MEEAEDAVAAGDCGWRPDETAGCRRCRCRCCCCAAPAAPGRDAEPAAAAAVAAEEARAPLACAGGRLAIAVEPADELELGLEEAPLCV